MVARHLSGAPVASSPTILDTDVETFQRDGVVKIAGVFSAEWLEYTRRAFREAMEKPGPCAEFIGEGTTWGTLFDEGASERPLEMFQDQECSQRLSSWATVSRESPAAPLIAGLMKSDTATFFYEHLILKRGGADRAIPWHQDLPYWKVDGSQIASVWVALDDMPASSGVRWVLGSHRWSLFQPKHFVDASPYEGVELPPLPDIDALLAQGEARTAVFDVKAGDALCFDARIVHGSPGNDCPPNNDHRRVALRFGGDDAVYCERQGETAIPTPATDAKHGLKHGDPLSCKVFPRVWPR